MIAAMAGFALATGHVMQYGMPFASETSDHVVEAPAPTTPNISPRPRPMMPVLAGGNGSLTDALPKAMEVAPPSLRAGIDPVARRPVPDDRIRVPDNRPYANLNAFGIPCDTSLEVTPMDEGQVALRLEANCITKERIVVWQDGLRFAARTSAVGVFEASIPAFRENTRFRVEFANGTSVEAGATVPGADAFDRVALLWSGTDNLSIHAFEFGATRGEAGHIHRTRPGPVARSSGTESGRIQRFGDPDVDAPLIAEVYSFPSGRAMKSGVVRLMVEVEVTPFSCGKTLDAEAIQTEAEGGLRSVALALDMPGCEAVGDILVLKNVLRDLRIARN